MGPFELADLVGHRRRASRSRSPSGSRASTSRAGARAWCRRAWCRPAASGARPAAATTTTRRDPYRDEDPEPPAPGGAGRVAIEGDGRLADDLREAAETAGYDVRFVDEFEEGETEILIDAHVGRTLLDPVPETEDPNALVCILCVDGSLAELDLRGDGGRLPRTAAVRRVTRGRADLVPRRPGVERNAGRRLLSLARQARRAGRRRARAGAGPDRLPARQRGGVRGQRGSRLARRTSTSRCGSATTGPAARSNGRTRSSSTTCSRRSTRSTRSFARSATAPPRCYGTWSPRDARPVDGRGVLRLRGVGARAALSARVTCRTSARPIVTGWLSTVATRPVSVSGSCAIPSWRRIVAESK